MSEQEERLLKENEQLKKDLELARGTLLLLNDFLWYETVPVGYKELIIKKLKENNVAVSKGWEEHND